MLVRQKNAKGKPTVSVAIRFKTADLDVLNAAAIKYTDSHNVSTLVRKAVHHYLSVKARRDPSVKNVEIVLNTESIS